MRVKNKMKKISKYLLILTLLLYGDNAMAGWDFMFSNKTYKDKIKIETYLVSEEKIGSILGKNDKMGEAPLALENYQELYGKKTYLVVRLKNEGRSGAWGILLCTIDKCVTKVYVNRVPFQEWDLYIIPIGTLTWNRSNVTPTVDVEWEKLYIK